MLMYNLLEYSNNYSMTSRSVWNYYEDEVNIDANEIENNYQVNNDEITTSRSFEYKTKRIGSTSVDNNMLDTDVVVLLNNLSNLPLFNYKTDLDLRWAMF